MGGMALGAAFVATVTFMMRMEANHHREIALKQFKEEQSFQTPFHARTSIFYDFIVVGGGTAGCLLAGKLSKHFRVLLLEAGGPPPSLTSIPGFREFAYTDNTDDIQWSYDSVFQKKLNRIVSKATGKMLGGSFAHNSLIFNRGNSRDYKNWAKLTKDPSWEYENILKMYKDLETYMGPFQSDLRGTNGSFPVYSQDLADLALYEAAAKDIGYTKNMSNTSHQEGIKPFEFTQSPLAVTSYSIFIEPFINIRKFLTVHTYSEAVKILFLGKTAKGVRYTRFGVIFSAFAQKEIIISAGTFGSPLLLFKSGIGPKEMLDDAKIPVRANLPVGKYLEEHTHVAYNITHPRVLTLSQNITAHTIETYLKTRLGDLSKVEYGAQMFITSSLAKSAGEVNWPDIQFRGEGGRLDEYGNAYSRAGIVIARPTSHGSLALNTTAYRLGERSNTRLALIDYNHFASEDDTIRCLEGIRTTLKLFNTKALQAMGMRMIPCDTCLQNAALNSTDYWKCMIREHTGTDSHPTGTCRMGFDSSAVIDRHFRVIGLRRLRVIDASVMPKITNANVNAPTLLIAEKGVLMLLKTHRHSMQKHNANQT